MILFCVYAIEIYKSNHRVGINGDFWMGVLVSVCDIGRKRPTIKPNHITDYKQWDHLNKQNPIKILLKFMENTTKPVYQRFFEPTKSNNNKIVVASEWIDHMLISCVEYGDYVTHFIETFSLIAYYFKWITWAHFIKNQLFLLSINLDTFALIEN